MKNTILLNRANSSDFFDFIDIIYKGYIIRYGGGYVSIWENEEKEIDCYIDNIFHFSQFKQNIKNKINDIINDKNIDK